MQHNFAIKHDPGLLAGLPIEPAWIEIGVLARANRAEACAGHRRMAMFCDLAAAGIADWRVAEAVDARIEALGALVAAFPEFRELIDDCSGLLVPVVLSAIARAPLEHRDGRWFFGPRAFLASLRAALGTSR